MLACSQRFSADCLDIDEAPLADSHDGPIDVQPGGRGSKRFRKTLATLAEAKQYTAWIQTKLATHPDWAPAKRETRRLSDLIDAWYLQHGATLRAGEDTKRRLLALAEAVGNPLADKFDSKAFAAYRTRRIAEGVSEANCNREHAYLRATYNELIRLGQWTLENPVAKVRQFKIPESELSYLNSAQIASLLGALAVSKNPHALVVTRVALSTGGRWGETEGLTISQVRDCKILFARTKTDRNRSVPISPELETEILAHHAAQGNGDRIFSYAEGAFKEAIERAGIELPDGQMTHVLRHYLPNRTIS